MPTSSEWQGVCHEIGHTVGFRDPGAESGVGCMSGGGTGWLSTHEIEHINGAYF